jgi:hypothetical protein
LGAPFSPFFDCLNGMAVLGMVRLELQGTKVSAVTPFQDA